MKSEVECLHFLIQSTEIITLLILQFTANLKDSIQVSITILISLTFKYIAMKLKHYMIFILAFFFSYQVKSQSVGDIISNSPNHTILAGLLQQTNLDAALDGEGPFTVFAPTDDAFSSLSQGLIDSVLADNELAQKILLYHVVGASALSTDLQDGQSIETLLGQSLNVNIDQNGVFINNAQVTNADLLASNGVVHVIDKVLIPTLSDPTTVMDIIENSDDHTILTVALANTGLDEVLRGQGSFTVFAPTDIALITLPADLLFIFDDSSILKQLLLYHVVDSEARSTDLSNGQTIRTVLGQDIVVTINNDGIFINNAKVTISDIIADNGVVHVLDAVLIPDFDVTTVYDIISNSPEHTILTQALQLTTLDSLLNDPSQGPFTVFAPTDAAFEALGQDVIDALVANPFKELLQALLYHVAIGNVVSTDLSDSLVITTALGQDVLVTINNNGIFINNAKVTLADLIATNGVVHVIDTVLIPDFGPCDVLASEIYSDFNNLFGGAPKPDENGDCGTYTLPFEAYASEGYYVSGFEIGAEYTFSICNGDNAGSWPADIVILDVDGNVVASVEDSCEITWVAVLEEYIIAINESGACGPISENLQTDNGNPSLTCRGRVPLKLMDIIEMSEIHTILKTALTQSGLDAALRGEDQLTIFAPTDEAFSKLPEGTLEAVIADPDLLNKILSYHVINGVVLSSDLSDGQIVTTLNGEDLMVRVDSQSVFINNAQVVTADIQADNGVLHMIDQVLLPPSNSVDVYTQNLNLYPSPAKDFIWFSDKSINDAWYEIRDLNGKLVLNGNLGDDRINVSNLGQGMYFVTIFDNDNSFIGRFIKF